jgi:mRNA interferase MazF
MPYKRGEVVLVLFPYSDLIGVKKRPGIVVQDETVPTGFDQQVVAQVSSNLARTGPTRVRIDKDTEDGQRMGIVSDSMVITDKIATVDSKAVEKVLGTCPCMEKVDAALSITLKLAVRPAQ